MGGAERTAVHVEHFVPRALPAPLASLTEQALDLRWSWNAEAKALWREVDAELWEATGNPVLILESVPRARLDELAADREFIALLAEVDAARAAYLESPAWVDALEGAGALGNIAYFSMEYGLSKALPIYSGGLGILAGDHVKTASDLGLPLVAVGLLYQQGYFRQSLDAAGGQLAFYPFNDPLWLPVAPVRAADGAWLRIALEFPGRSFRLRTWQARVGRATLYLLDSNDPLNDPRDRGITSELYGGGAEQRLQQEIVLGIGGWRLLEALGLDCAVCHLNEGHAAFAALERARTFAAAQDLDFDTALACTRAGNLFTTHTPVAAGFDRFDPALMQHYLGRYAEELGLGADRLLALGRARPGDEPFNMAFLALRTCGAVNGVSRLHGEVSRRIFAPVFARLPLEEVPVGHVTNGVHVPTWDSRAAARLWFEACREGHWCGELGSIAEDFRKVTDAELWALRCGARARLVEWVRERHRRELAARGEGDVPAADLLDPDTLTLGFARRFATYKRPNLLLLDPERLQRLLGDLRRPVQLVIAGKAHPRDAAGQALVRAWSDFLHRPAVRLRAVFIEDYDMGVAAELVHGVDLWVNTPRRPWEASGTSGMKVLANAGLNLSELDGWWAEAYAPDLGWALGDRAEHDEDPAWDRSEAEALYGLLEREVVPAFYHRDEHGLPGRWLARVRESMARLTGRFSANRMVREYTERYYLPAAAAYRARAADGAERGRRLHAWDERVRHHWPRLRIAGVTREHEAGCWRVAAQVFLGELEPDDVKVELYAAGHAPHGDAERVAMARGEALAGAHAFVYHAQVSDLRPIGDYTVRLLPDHPDARLPLESPLVLWER